MREALPAGMEPMQRGRVEEAATRLEAAIADYGETVDSWLDWAYLHFSGAAALAGWLEKGMAAAKRSVDLRLELLCKYRQDKIIPGESEPFRVLALNAFLAGVSAATYQALERCSDYFGSPNIKHIAPDGTLIGTDSCS